MKSFIKNNYDEELYGRKIDIDNCDIKIYQNLLVYSFIKNNLKPGAKILELGNNVSQVLNFFRNDYECCNIKFLKEDRTLKTLKKNPG